MRNHLLLADTATRRDLGDERTISRFAEGVGDPGRNALLYVLTVGDSRATGPAAWSASKATLVRELFAKTDAYLRDRGADDEPTPDPRAALGAIVGASEAEEYLDAMPAAYGRAFEAVRPGAPPRAARRRRAGGRVDRARRRCACACIVVEPDRTGLLATAAAALALVGFDIDSAAAHSPPRRHGARGLLRASTASAAWRLPTTGRRATATIAAALDGERRARRAAAARTRAVPARGQRPGADRDVRVLVDTDASAVATVVEVHAPDDVGLLARVAAVFVDLELDVDQAIVSTVGDRVVDVFYLRDAVRDALHPPPRGGVAPGHALSRLTAAVTLDERPGSDG